MVPLRPCTLSGQRTSKVGMGCWLSTLTTTTFALLLLPAPCLCTTQSRPCTLIAWADHCTCVRGQSSSAVTKSVGTPYRHELTQAALHKYDVALQTSNTASWRARAATCTSATAPPTLRASLQAAVWRCASPHAQPLACLLACAPLCAKERPDSSRHIPFA